jgi:uncharacterized membrane protein
MPGDAPKTRAEAQRRADRVRQFQAELAEAERDGALTLTADQRARLHAYHDGLLARFASSFDVDVSDRQKQISLGMQAVAAIGAIALAASVFLFFFTVWGRMGTGLQVAVLVAAPLWLVGLTEIAARRPSLRFLTWLLTLVAFASFILNIGQLGEIFALTPSPEAVLAVGVFAVALAYAYGQRLLLAAGASCLAIYLAAVMVRFAGGWWLPPGLVQRLDGFLISGAAIVGWSCVPHRVRDEFPDVLRATGLIVLCVPILVLTHQGLASWLPIGERAVEIIYQTLSFLVPAAAIAAGMRRGWPGTIGLGGALFSIALFIKYVDWWWDWMPRYVFFLVVGATALLLLWLFGRVRARVRVA